MSLILAVGSVQAQQSTTGPERPPGIDLGVKRVTEGENVVIPGVPAYLWHHGCGPTALGMVIGYWDGRLYPDMVPGDASTQTAAVNAMMADDGGQSDCGIAASSHFHDYACPLDSAGCVTPDRSQTGGAHPDNCLADFMFTSQSSMGNCYGRTWFDHIADAFIQYVDMVAPQAMPDANSFYFFWFNWDIYKDQIDRGRPMLLLVDIDGDDEPDHMVTAIGYNDQTMEYGVYDTWDTEIHWYPWHGMDEGHPWGVYGIVRFGVESICVDSDGDGFGDPGHPENMCPVDNCPNVYNPLQEDRNSDGIGDLCCCVGIRGHINGDLEDKVNISDIAYLVKHLFAIPSGPEPGCLTEANANGDSLEKYNISDVTYLVKYLFGIPPGPPPPPCP